MIRNIFILATLLVATPIYNAEPASINVQTSNQIAAQTTPQAQSPFCTHQRINKTCCAIICLAIAGAVASVAYGIVKDHNTPMCPNSDLTTYASSGYWHYYIYGRDTSPNIYSDVFCKTNNLDGNQLALIRKKLD